MVTKNEIKNFILDLIFPRFCVGCNLEGSLLCRKCAGKIIQIKAQICPECQRLSENGKFCKKCAKKFDLSGIIVAAYFEEGPIREMVHNFKYNHVLELKKELTDLLNKAVNQEFDLITFTPLHHRRLAERGFNQSEVLAQELSKRVKIPCESLLIKTKYTKRQVGLSGSKRRKNLTNVFKVKSNQDIVGKKILIIDDITTTGTTLNECAKALKSAGAKEVWGMVVARG